MSAAERTLITGDKGGEGGSRERSVLSAQFFCKPQTALKNVQRNDSEKVPISLSFPFGAIEQVSRVEVRPGL